MPQHKLAKKLEAQAMLNGKNESLLAVDIVISLIAFSPTYYIIFWLMEEKGRMFS